MRIACPSCSAEYQVPDALLASGPRLLRCARCGHQFQAALPAPAAPQEADAPAMRAGPGAPAASAARAEPGATALPAAPAAARPAAEPPAAASPPLPPPALPLAVPPSVAAGPYSLDLAPPVAEPAEAEEPVAPRDRPPPTRGLTRHSPIDPLPPPTEAGRAPRTARLLAAAWLLSFAVLGAAIWAGYGFRAEIREAFPPAQRLYGLLGIE